MNVGLMLPFAVFGNIWPVDSAPAWVLRGLVIYAVGFLWWLTVGWILLFIGMVSALAAESYHKEVK